MQLLKIQEMKKNCKENFYIKIRKDFERYEWARVCDAINQPSLFGLKGEITPLDPVQGNLSNCYFLSSASALSLNPERIKRLFLIKCINGNSFYAVTLCITGVFREIWLDDYFPFKKGRFKFCKPKNDKIWAMLLEKAYSKIFGAFWNVGCGGHAGHALKDLSGAPTECFDLINYKPENIYKIIKEFLNKKFAMTATTKEKGFNENKGVITWHAYTILGIYENDTEENFQNGAYKDFKYFKDSKGGKDFKDFKDRDKYLIKLRDPWGKGGWNGIWSKNCKKWTKKLKEKFCYYEYFEDGVFYMPVSEFLKTFLELEVCYYHDSYFLTQKLNPATRETFNPFQIIIKEPGEYYISLSQQDKRLRQHKEHCFVSFVVLDYTKDKIKYIGGIGIKKRDIFIKSYLNSGVYVIIVYIFCFNF